MVEKTEQVEPGQEPARGTDSEGRWSAPWMQLIASIVILAGILVFLYPSIASWFAQREQSRAIEIAQSRAESPPFDDPEVVSEELTRARQYNEQLASGAIYEANENVATSDIAEDDTQSDDPLAYNNLLNAGDDGFMGRLRYEDLDIDLPIYHGTDDDTLRHGVGHLEGTSLPVGGEGTRSVLTAHRGLPESTLFDELDQAEEGDLITLSVMNEVLAYQVREVRVIEPDQTEAILPEQNRDLITLVTCTPLGINSHRILVTAERVYPTPVEAEDAARASSNLPHFPWWLVILTVTVAALGWSIWRGGKRPGVTTNDSQIEPVSPATSRGPEPEECKPHRNKSAIGTNLEIDAQSPAESEQVAEVKDEARNRVRRPGRHAKPPQS